jgi:predicted RNA methylase
MPARVPDIGYEPTPYAVADAMLRLAHVDASDVVFDLGSGDGRIVNMAATRYGARGVGVELQPDLVAQSRRSARESGISELKQELRPGTRIVSHSFDFGDWVPRETVRASDGTNLFLWTVPRRPRRTPDVPFVATPQNVVYQMLDLAHATSADIVFDLGSGDGRIPIIASQRYGARAVGIEIDPNLIEISTRVAHDNDLDGKVTFQEADLFSADISSATVVTLYLSADVNSRLERKLKHDLRPGTRVVSREFPIGGWMPDKTMRADDGTALFLWGVPPGRGAPGRR